MILDPIKIALAQSEGVLNVCSQCTRYHEARDLGMPKPSCTTRVGCGSPISGNDFSDYRGPLTDLKSFCFACGAQSDYLVGVHDKVNLIGVCQEHTKLLVELTVRGRVIPQRVIYTKEEIIPVENLFKKTEKNLISAIAEADAYFAEQRATGKKL